MKYEFQGKSLAAAVAHAVAKQPVRKLDTKGSDSDSATVRSGGTVRLQIEVEANEYYTVRWEARTPSDDNDYYITIQTDVGFGSHSETFSDSGSWDFRTRDYSGPVTIVVGFDFAYSVLRRCDVWVG